MASKSSSLSDDVHRPLDVKTLRRIWDSAPREYDYWVPASDIEGAIPPDLKGTLLRNGPGLNEIYGKRLQHRKQLCARAVHACVHAQLIRSLFLCTT